MIDCADVHIRWLTPDEGGRVTPFHPEPIEGVFYRPHFRVGARGEYLGVQFVAGAPPIVAPGAEGDATVWLVYADNGVDYRPLAPGASFEVLEGPRVVGRGAVRRRYTAPAGAGPVACAPVA